MWNVEWGMWSVEWLEWLEVGGCKLTTDNWQLATGN
jgi:hypothetical protein